MKKYVRFFAVVVVLAAFALMALGSGSDSEEVKAPASVSGGNVQEDVQKTEEETQDTGEQTQETEETVPVKTEVTIEEAVLLDEADIKITAKSFEADGFMGPAVKLLIENNSQTNVGVQAWGVSVNGYMVDTIFSADVAAGKKANEELIFSSSSLEEAGITTIADMEFYFHIYDSETWDTYLDSAPVVIKTSAADGFVYEYDNSGDVVYNENGVEIVVKGLSEEFMGPCVVVYISNTSQKNISVQTRDVSINGFMVDAIFSSEVNAGKHIVDTITFLSSELEENGITTIEDIELSLHIFDSDTWMTIKDTNVITLSFAE